jgi:hypothetical protein
MAEENGQPAFGRHDDGGGHDGWSRTRPRARHPDVGGIVRRHRRDHPAAYPAWPPHSSHLQTTRGYVAVFNEDVVRHYPEFLDRPRKARSVEEYKPVTNSEWSEFEETFRPAKGRAGWLHATIRFPPASVSIRGYVERAPCRPRHPLSGHHAHRGLNHAPTSGSGRGEPHAAWRHLP